MLVRIPVGSNAKVLATLYNAAITKKNASPVELMPMTVEEATLLLKENSSFGKFRGRQLNIDFGAGMLKTYLYNFNNGEKAAEKALAAAGII